MIAVNDLEDIVVQTMFSIDKEFLDKLKEFVTPELKKHLTKGFSSVSILKHFNNTEKKLKSPPKGKRFGNRNGYREDMQETFKSKHEANVARFLTKKYGRICWEYEVDQFILPLVTVTGKAKVYTPDFRVKRRDGSFFYIEVKPGFLPNAGDKLKLRTFKKEYPQVDLVILTRNKSDKVISWAKKYNFEVWIYEDLIEYCKTEGVELE